MATSKNKSPTTMVEKKDNNKIVNEAASQVVKRLKLFDGISCIVGLMVGSGIFTTVGESQGQVGSPGMALIMMGISGLLALTGALCYAELGTMIPGSGGEAQYLVRGFGPIMAFLFNWVSILILKPGTIAILSAATARYLLQMGFNIAGVESSQVLSVLAYSWIERGVGAGCCILITLASALSTKWSNRVQGVLTLGKIGALALIIGSGVYYAIFADSSVIKSNMGSPFSESIFSFTGIAIAINNGLWGFEGWNNLNIVAGDLANPAVNLPLSIWISMVAVIILYILTLFGYYAVVPKATVAVAKTIGIDFGLRVFGSFGTILMPILIASSTFGAALSSMVTSSEIIVLAAQTGHMPKYFGKISPTLGTAARAYWMQGILSIILISQSDIQGLVVLYTFPTWIFYAACVIVLIKLRFTEPKLERPYRVFPSTPVFFLLSCGLLLVNSAIAEPIPIIISIGVVLLGLPLYFLLGLGLEKGVSSPMDRFVNAILCRRQTAEGKPASPSSIIKDRPMETKEEGI